MACRRRIAVNPILRGLTRIVDHNCEMKQSAKICIKSLWILISWAGASCTIKSSFCCLKPCVNGRIVTLLGVAASFCTKLKVWPVSNFAQQLPITCNRVFKRTQNLTYHNVGSFWPTILRPFTQGLMIHWFVLGLLETRTLESESDGQTNRPPRYKCGKVPRLICDSCDTVDTCFDCEQRVEIVWG